MDTFIQTVAIQSAVQAVVAEKERQRRRKDIMISAGIAVLIGFTFAVVLIKMTK